MIQINLLPIRQMKKRQRLYQQAGFLLILLLALFSVLGTTTVTITGRVNDLNSDIAALNKKKGTFQKTINEINKLKKDQESLENKLEAIKKLKEGSQKPVRILDALATLTPTDRLWLKTLRQTETELQISGVALDNATIAQYMDALSDSPYFADTKLGSTKLTQLGSRKLKSFSLTISIKYEEPTEPPTVANSPKGRKKR